MVKPAATWLGELTGHLVGESLVVARGAAPRLEGGHRLPLPAALADLAARVDYRLELLAREEPVEHGRAVASALVMRPGTQVRSIFHLGVGMRRASAMERVASTVSAVPRITVESSFTGMTTMPPSAAAR